MSLHHDVEQIASRWRLARGSGPPDAGLVAVADILFRDLTDAARCSGPHDMWCACTRCTADREADAEWHPAGCGCRDCWHAEAAADDAYEARVEAMGVL